MNQEEKNNRLFVCRAARCKKNGSDELVDLLEKVLKIKIDQDVSENLIQLESSHCLGQCAYGPNIRANNKIYNKVDRQVLKRVLVIMKSRLSEAGENG